MLMNQENVSYPISVLRIQLLSQRFSRKIDITHEFTLVVDHCAIFLKPWVMRHLKRTTEPRQHILNLDHQKIISS